MTRTVGPISLESLHSASPSQSHGEVGRAGSLVGCVPSSDFLLLLLLVDGLECLLLVRSDQIVGGAAAQDLEGRSKSVLDGSCVINCQ